MKKIIFTEFVENLIANIDGEILTLSNNQMNTIIQDFHDEPDLLKLLLIEVEKKRDYYFQKQNSYNYTHFKTAGIYLIIIIALAYLWYCIAMYYFIPLQKELEALIWQLEPLGITFIEGKTQSAGLFKQISESTHLTATQYVTARELMSQISYVNAQLHSIVIKGIHSAIIPCIITFLIIMCSTIRKGILPKYKERYKKYCLIEQKLQKVIT